MSGKPVPKDLLFFIRDHVFPTIPPSVLEDLVSCSRVSLMAPGDVAERPGLYIVYSGMVKLGGNVYERGDYFHLPSGSEAVAEKESIVIYVSEECSQDIIRFSLGESCRIGDLVFRSPVTVKPDISVRKAVEVMAANGVSSVIVVSEKGEPIGIFTDTDLRRLVARGASLDAPLESVMSRDPFWLPPATSCLDAVYAMMERNVKHLVVADRKGLIGVVTVRDIAYAEALGPLYVRRIIASAGSVEELGSAYQRLLRVLRMLGQRLHPVTAGGNVVSLVRMASLALRSVLARAAVLAARRLGVERGEWAYMVMGSNARLEQVSATDRDTLLVYRGLSREEAGRLAEEIEDVLDRIGFPGCPHGYTARKLVFHVDELLELLRNAAARPADKDNIVLIGLFSDAVTVYPETTGLDSLLRRSLSDYISSTGSSSYVRQALAAYRPRLGPLGRLPKRLDVKKQGLAPIVFAAKALALGAGVWREVGTGERLEALAARHVISRELATEALEAYRVVLGFSAWSMSLHGARELSVDELSGLERSLLRSSLQAAARLVDKARAAI